MPDTIWIDGAPFAGTDVRVRLHEELVGARGMYDRCHAGGRAFHSTIYWQAASSARAPSQIERSVQVWLAEHGRGFIGLGGAAAVSSPWLGPVFEVDPVGVVPAAVDEGWSFEAPVVVVADDLRVDVPIRAARIRQLAEPVPKCHSWVSVLVELELEPGPLPSLQLVMLTQPRTARRLSIATLGGEGVTLAEVGCVRAVVLGVPERPLAVDAPSTLQLLLSSRVPRATRANELEPLPSLGPADFADTHARLEALAEYCRAVDDDANEVVTALRAPSRQAQLQALVERFRGLRGESASARMHVAFAELVDDPAALVEQLRAALGPEPSVEEIRVYDPVILARHAHPQLGLVWLRRACAHAQPRLTSVERRLVELLDRQSAASIEAHEWDVLADELLSRGDPLGQALRDREPPRDGPERALWEATQDPDGRWRIEDHEWAPRVRGTWVGPLLTTLVVEPGFCWLPGSPEVIDEGPTQCWPETDNVIFRPIRDVHLVNFGPHGDVVSAFVSHIDESLKQWHEPPGFDARPELLDILRLPCCRLLSPRRVILAGDSPPSFEYIGAMLEGVDLSGLGAIRSPLLQRAKLRGANLRKLELHEGSLAGADLREADLREVLFEGVELVDTDLRGADLRGAQLHVAPRLLAGAKLRGAKIDADSVEFWRARGFDPDEFELDGG